MRLLSRLLGACLALALLGGSAMTALAHNTPTANDDYGVRLYIELRDEKEVVTVGTKLSFFVVVERGSEHGVPNTASLRSVTPGGYSSTNLSTNEADSLVVGGKSVFSKTVEYTVQRADLGIGAKRREAPIRFRLTFTPTDTQGNEVHSPVTIDSNSYDVVVVDKAPKSSGDGDSEVELSMTMDGPSSIAKGRKVTFNLTIITGQYRLVTKALMIRKQLYDAANNKIGGAVRAQSFVVRLLSNSVSEVMSKTYTLTEKDVNAAKIEFSYELTVTDLDLRDADNTLTDLDTDFEETFAQTFTVGGVPTPTPTATPNPLVGSTGAARVTQRGNTVHVDRLDGGADFSLSLGWVAPTGARAFNPQGYIRDDYRGQTYAVVRRESDNKVVRIWISADSPERYQVPWDTVLRNYTVPLNVLLAIPLDEDTPAENQLVRRFDNVDNRIYVYRARVWRHVPDIPTFQANGFYWCNVTAADAQFFVRALIGPPLPRSGTAEDPDYPSCHNL